MEEVLRFWKKRKLSPRFIGPYEVLERIRQVAYRLAHPPELAKLHDVFHVSMLRKYRSMGCIHYMCKKYKYKQIFHMMRSQRLFWLER